MIRSLTDFLASYPIVAAVIGFLLVVGLTYNAFLTIRDIHEYNKSCEVDADAS